MRQFKLRSSDVSAITGFKYSQLNTSGPKPGQKQGDDTRVVDEPNIV
jgi:hypothetical protein